MNGQMPETTDEVVVAASSATGDWPAWCLVYQIARLAEAVEAVNEELWQHRKLREDKR
jgi:hypothetical protein